jgi:putative phosphoesterase
MPGSQAPVLVRTRVGLIGDIHTEADVLAWALELLKSEKAEVILATGDIPDGRFHGPGVDRVCEMLEQAGVLCVCGNHDRWLLEGEMRDLPDATFPEEVSARAREYLRSLPATLELETPLGRMLLGHGLANDDMATLYPHDHGLELTNNDGLQALLRERRYALCVHGHTHRRMLRVLDGITFINAGTLRVKREPGCVLLDFVAKEARFYDYAEGGKTSLALTQPL